MKHARTTRTVPRRAPPRSGLRIGSSRGATEREADAFARAGSRLAPTMRSSPTLEAPAQETVFEALSRGGQPLDGTTRDHFEPRLGIDLASVRVHTDETAVTSARDAGAHAYAVGSHIVLGGAAQRATGPERRALLAHELAHVAQQSGPGATLHVARQEAKPEDEERDKKRPKPAPDILDFISREAFGLSGLAEYQAKFAAPGSVSFLGVPVHGWVHQDIAAALSRAERSKVSERRMSQTLMGKYGPVATKSASHGISRISSDAGGRKNNPTYHSFGMAIDINASRQPFLMHEHGEAALDTELGPVYDRISKFMLSRASAVRSKAKSVRGAKRKAAVEARHLALSQESWAMKRYFAFLKEPQTLLPYMRTPDGFLAWRLAMGDNIKGSAALPQSKIDAIATPRDARLMHIQIMKDWAVLTGRAGPDSYVGGVSGKASVAIKRIPPVSWKSILKGVKRRKGQDRPFQKRSRDPLDGFLFLKKEIVVALTGAGGLRWGGLDFEGGGDIHHFDVGFKRSGDASRIRAARREYFRRYPKKKR